MATAAIGGSHLVASTQAGAIFGWQLFWLILVVNVLKYPFFRFGMEYTLATKNSLVEGYKSKGPFYFYSFIGLNIVAAVVNTAGVLLLTASLLHYALPVVIEVTLLCWILLGVCLAILLLGHFKALDSVAKGIMGLLTLATVIALVIAFSNGPMAPADYVGPSPYELAMLSFMVALMGWMPAPIEISALSSLWLKEKQAQQTVSKSQGLFDFNVGYWLTAGLALVFFSLGVLVQYGQTSSIELGGVAFAKQLIDMYALTIGEWARPLVSAIAFLCMFGTTLTVLDGYARTLNESHKLLGFGQSKHSLNIWLILQALAGMAVILFFKSALGPMLTFAMTLSFVTTPVFAWLNFSLVRSEPAIKHSVLLRSLTWLGLVYLVGFAVAFVVWKLAA
ncbi:MULTISPECIES: NRAMP family divalent metal transporter [Pseudoalteromonas]|uniref:NRAMP family divalent metal transporter n=1 Tax=Pseudoalteromonas TaxID=53246 RepID=UPI0013FD7574|nr:MULTISPECIES: divalent metal cation transporter [Pseudoalteromonas]MBB1304642.1 divalent metal cation transporter [Pseudoalteromonas sp. SR43-5]MBB1348381.1 divalent metal cation transporter [Pseudoalteromonas sp. SG45-3]MBB1358019.1 divalent metal cation transporter [Pseudoalteromonas sp. SG45-6]MBB1444809.1 divalent metal cation transporter [Pseudoalteromonas sp. SG43-3]